MPAFEKALHDDIINFTMALTSLIYGQLHFTLAFDWGDEIDLSHAARLMPAEIQSLPRRRRTPSSIAYRPPPLLIRLSPTILELPELGKIECETEATVFDFGGIALNFQIPLHLLPEQLTRLAASLAQPISVVSAGREAARKLFIQLQAAIKNPTWNELSEEYSTFQFPPQPELPPPAELVEHHAEWLAGLVRLDDTSLSADEIQEALRMRISYTPHDLVIVEWGAAVVIDDNCEETLQTVEFANLQLLEFRLIDSRVDEVIDQACKLIHPLTKTWLPFWRSHSRPLRMLGDMRIDSVVLFERTSNALKLVGDQYLARLYRLLTARFRLEEWTSSIRESIAEAQGVYEILTAQSANTRLELLELVVIVLIAFEIGFVMWGH
jgi:hypothetical protein